MSNDQIVEILELTVKLMELHNADAFKTRTLANATFNLDRFKTANLAELPVEELVKIQGVGKSMAQKIVQLVQTGHLPELDELIAQTPAGVLEMFKIKGIGPKKIGTIWRDLGIESIQALKEACENGQIAKLKGFGAGTQQKILDSLAFMESQAGKLRMDKGEALAAIVLEELQKHFSKVGITGDVARKNEIVETIQLLVATEAPVAAAHTINQLGWLVQHPKESSPFVWRGSLRDRTASTDELPPQGEEIEVKKTIEAHVEIIFTAPEKFENDRFIFESSQAHLALVTSSGHTLFQIANSDRVENVEAIYQKANLPYVVPEMREGWGELEWRAQYQNDELITWNDLKGILHNHSTYSDGKHSLETMAEFCKELGFEYLGIADHSQSAAYANGLREDRIRIQHEEIDHLNQKLAPFKILKGIESDILGDGSLDYPSEILATFDYVVASVHSNLNMGIEKATSRLLTAIENPFTTILGHPTGRLLLAREGYPIDHKTIIDACAHHGVVIEINASPWRLDLDWRWIRYCMERGVMLSINPDAHEKEGYYDMHYGVGVARKGGLTKSMTFNALSLTEIESYFQQRKK